MTAPFLFPRCLANYSISRLRLGKSASFGLRSFLRLMQRLQRLKRSIASRCEQIILFRNDY